MLTAVLDELGRPPVDGGTGRGASAGRNEGYRAANLAGSWPRTPVPLHPQRVIAELRAALPDDAVI